MQEYDGHKGECWGNHFQQLTFSVTLTVVLQAGRSQKLVSYIYSIFQLEK